MTENKKAPPLADLEGDIPDMSGPEWDEIWRHGYLSNGEKGIWLRLSPEVMEHFGVGSVGWQERIDEALKAFISQRLADL